MFNWMMTEWISCVLNGYLAKKKLVKYSQIQSFHHVDEFAVFLYAAHKAHCACMKLLENHRMHCCISN